MHTNPHVAHLMGWHPSGDAGVRIPFRGVQRPLAARIQTPLIERLRAHAQQLANGDVVPRVILLVGGSGNGKTDAIEAYVEELDAATGSNGALLGAVRDAFFQTGKLPAWLVKLDAVAISSSNAALSRLGTLCVLQDASASEEPDGDAAKRLADQLDKAMKFSGDFLLLACVNRGLLNRVLRQAVGEAGQENVVALIKAVAMACSEVGHRDSLPTCWPLALPEDHPFAGKAATWPLDIESLLINRADSASAFDQVFDVATSADKWDDGQCGSCPSMGTCPFRQNAAWLRLADERKHLLRLLRDFEVATGARWTFRQLFGLAAELLAGHPSTFEGQDPCEWVHGHAEIISNMPANASHASLLALLRRLYPFVLFPLTQDEGAAASRLSAGSRRVRSSPLDQDVVRFLDVVASWRLPTATHLQQRVAKVLAPRFDPSRRGSAWNDGSDQMLEGIFEAADVSVGNGLRAAKAIIELSELEQMYLERIATSESSVDTLQRASVIPQQAIGFLRSFAAALLTRAVGTRRGAYALRSEVQRYEEEAQRTQGLLKLTANELPKFLAPPDGRLRFDLLETLGQQALSEDRHFRLISRTAVRGKPVRSNISGQERPATELPTIDLKVRHLPLTFDLFMALRERSQHRSASSESVAIRAAIGQLRVLLAGSATRNTKAFEELEYWYEVGDEHQIQVTDAGQGPVLVRKEQ